MTQRRRGRLIPRVYRRIWYELPRLLEDVGELDFLLIHSCATKFYSQTVAGMLKPIVGSNSNFDPVTTPIQTPEQSLPQTTSSLIGQILCPNSLANRRQMARS
jgi:hypothetical protein